MANYTLQKVKGIWQCYFLTRDGERFRRSTRETDKRRADAVAAEWERKYADPTYSRAAEITVGDAAENFGLALDGQALSPETRAFYKQKAGTLVRILGEDRRLETVTASVVDDVYVPRRRAEKVEQHTIKKELGALRLLLAHAKRRGEYTHDIDAVIPRFDPGYKPRKRWITIDEAWRLIHDLPEAAARYVAFVCATTCRDAGVYRARGEHLSDEGIRLLDQKTEASTRTVPLTPITEAFAAHAFRGIAPRDHLVPPTLNVHNALNASCKRLGLAHLSPNDLRRSAGHWLLQARVPRYVVARFFGHTTTRMLDLIYGKSDDGELRTAMEAALPRPEMQAADLDTEPLGSCLDQQGQSWQSWQSSAPPVPCDETPKKACDSEARMGFEPTYNGFAIRTEGAKTGAEVGVSAARLDPVWTRLAAALPAEDLRATLLLWLERLPPAETI